jgi:hypothetical protein
MKECESRKNAVLDTQYCIIKEVLMKAILVIDGGGAKGIIPVTVLKKMESKLDKPLHEAFDLVVTTSVGSIIGGVLCSGKMDMNKLQELMLESLPVVFEKRIRVPFIQPKYTRKPLVKILEDYIGKETQMKDCKTKFMCTSVNMVDGRTHFFKSWEEKDGQLNLIDAINRSYAAPLFFGKIIDKETKSVWLDGGTGSSNTPLLQAYIEIRRQKWWEPCGEKENKICIISLGCGYSRNEIPFEKAYQYLNVRQTLYYMDPVNGGLAREQVSFDQVMWLEDMANTDESLIFQRIDKEISGELNKMDAIEFSHDYKKIGEEIAEMIDYTCLR